MRVGVRGPNTENFNKKFYRQCALGYGAPTQRISTRNSTDNARWGTGPQHREFQQEILQTMRVGVRGPNTENFNKKFYRQCALGYGAPTQRISTRNSTDNARWGTGPQHREFQQEILQTMRVGVRGPNTENFNKKFYKQCALGYGPQHRKD
ncbi:hypothetical protein BJR00_11175 [Staphylococcus aureus]|nr:hypothetical protein BJR00_11175 [Staphylococcus aureus]